MSGVFYTSFGEGTFAVNFDVLRKQSFDCLGM